MRLRPVILRSTLAWLIPSRMYFDESRLCGAGDVP